VKSPLQQPSISRLNSTEWVTDIFEFILFVIGAILTMKMISNAFRLGHRIANATEGTAKMCAVLYANLPPEAKERGDRYLKDLAK
jgi:hypothetical protein